MRTTIMIAVCLRKNWNGEAITILDPRAVHSGVEQASHLTGALSIV